MYRCLRWQKTSSSRSLGSAAEYAALPGPGELRAMEAAILARPDMPSASAARLRTLIAAAVDLAEQADELVERLDELLAADRT